MCYGMGCRYESKTGACIFSNDDVPLDAECMREEMRDEFEEIYCYWPTESQLDEYIEEEMQLQQN